MIRGQVIFGRKIGAGKGREFKHFHRDRNIAPNPNPPLIAPLIVMIILRSNLVAHPVACSRMRCCTLLRVL